MKLFIPEVGAVAAQERRELVIVGLLLPGLLAEFTLSNAEGL